MTNIQEKIFTLKQKNLINELKKNYFLNDLIMDSESIILYPNSSKIIDGVFLNHKNMELRKESSNLIIKKEILEFFETELNDIAYAYFYGGINNSAKFPIELFPLFIIKIKSIDKWLELINKPNFYCLKFFNDKIDKIIDISMLGNNEENIISVFAGIKV